MITLKEVFAHPSICFIAVVKELDFDTKLPTEETEKTYKAFINAVKEEGIKIINEISYSKPIGKVAIEMTSTYNRVNGYVTTHYADNVKGDRTPFNVIDIADTTLLINEKTVHIYRHKVLPRNTEITF